MAQMSTRVAFLVHAHRCPQQLAHLAACLTSAGDSVFFHIDAKSDPSGYRSLAALPNVTVHPDPVPVFHAGFSQVRATLLLLRQAIAAGPYTHYALLSGQCFPTRPLLHLHALLEEDADFIHSFPMPDLRIDKPLRRLEHFHLEQPRWRRLNPYLRQLPKRNFVKGLSGWPHAGSNWWTLRHDTVEQILRYVADNPGFVRFMRFTSYADESFFQTIVATLGIRELRPNLLWTRFNPTTGSPYVLTLDDLPEALEKAPFIVRKVDLETHPEVLDALRELVLGSAP